MIYLSPKAALNEIGRQKDKLITASAYEKNIGSDFRKKLISDIYTAYRK